MDTSPKAITVIQFRDHMKVKKKEDQSVGASALLRRRTKYSQEQIWGEKGVEQGLKERPSRDCPTWGFIPYTVTKPRHYYGCKKCMPKGA